MLFLRRFSYHGSLQVAVASPRTLTQPIPVAPAAAALAQPAARALAVPLSVAVAAATPAALAEPAAAPVAVEGIIVCVCYNNNNYIVSAS